MPIFSFTTPPVPLKFQTRNERCDGDRTAHYLGGEASLALGADIGGSVQLPQKSAATCAHNDAHAAKFRGPACEPTSTCGVLRVNRHRRPQQ